MLLHTCTQYIVYISVAIDEELTVLDALGSTLLGGDVLHNLFFFYILAHGFAYHTTQFGGLCIRFAVEEWFEVFGELAWRQFDV